MIAALGMMVFTIISVTTFNQIDRSILGYKAFIVLSDSMSKTDFNAGDLVISKIVDPSTLKEGDIISFQSTNDDSYGKVLTHKIRALTTDESGAPCFITYGTTTDVNDESKVAYNFVMGKYVTHIPKAGDFFYFLKSTQGYILCIFLPFMLLILLQALNSLKLFRQYKREQFAEIEEQRKSLDEERKKSQEMMAEILKLKEQLSGGADKNASPDNNE